MSGAVGQVREAMAGDIHRKRRDFLKVHNRGGEPCPRCGAAISQLTANQRITSYCRTCQPGLLLEKVNRMPHSNNLIGLMFCARDSSNKISQRDLSPLPSTGEG